MAEKEVMMKLKVDVHCKKCMKKVKKVLSKFPEIREQTIDEKQNLVIIKVVCIDPEKIRDKICCKSEGSIKTIEILPVKKPPPPEPPKPPPPEPPKPPPPAPPKPPPPAPPKPPLPEIVCPPQLVCYVPCSCFHCYHGRPWACKSGCHDGRCKGGCCHGGPSACKCGCHDGRCKGGCRDGGPSACKCGCHEGGQSACNCGCHH